ncbi:MAG: hypothetical protein ACFCGT_17090, partial [Sandaracinaceae bacterium]
GDARPAEAPRGRRRVLALTAAALAMIALGAFALRGGEEAPAGPGPDASASAAGPQTPPAPAAVPTPEAASPTPEAEEPAPEPGGRLDEPVFPSLDGRAEPPAPVEAGTSFGAATVVDGETFTLRMSEPVTLMRGQDLADGFMVTIPGSFSQDPAAPIAARHSAVERSVILNRWEQNHSVLTVRFVPGREPAYRVVAAGSRLEITIGR